MAIYTKITGTILNAEDLLNVLATNLISYGWTVEFIGDNIISSVNLGKKLIVKKGSIYTYFAASDNNNPTGNTTSFITNNISCLKFCSSLTLNTSNNWYLNNAQGSGANQPSGLQLSAGATYKLYINNNNFILTVNFATGLYSTIIIGNTTRNCFIAAGSILGVQLQGARLRNIPFLQCSTDRITTIFRNNIYINNANYENNHFKSSNFIYIPAYETYRGTTSSLLNSGHINRAYSSLYNISMIYDVKYFELITSTSYNPLFYIENFGLVNFGSLSSTQSENEGISIGIKTFDFIPFLNKETPQIYSNNENWGCGFAVQVG